jgi:hypothetical protein
MRQLLGVVVMLSLLFVIGLTTSAATYAVYYACTERQDTAIVIMNSSGSETHYMLKVYDAYGSLLEATQGQGKLAGYESDYQMLSGLITPGEYTYGLVLIESPAILTIGVETFIENTWVGSDNIVDAVPAEPDHTYYWYSLNYSNTAKQTTGIAIINPNNSPAAATLFVYDAFGEQNQGIDIVLDPYETDYYYLKSSISIADHMWGTLDVKATVPLIVAAEYFDADEILLNVDQGTHFYYYE